MTRSASGLAITPFAACSALISYLAGKVVTRWGRPLVAAGLAVVVLGLVATAVVVHIADVVHARRRSAAG